MGYVYQGCLSPKHWFQFADDITIVTALEKDNQLLCNGFMKWTTWADLIVRDDKCHTFGIKKQKQKVTSFSHSSGSETKEYHLSKTVKVSLTLEKILIAQ